MTFIILVQHPLFRDVITNPVLITDEARRCLATAKQYTSKKTSLSERFVHSLESALQPVSRCTSPRGVLDPALDPKTGPMFANLTEASGAVEMALLEACYMKRKDLISACGLPVTEVVSLW